jgi:hypothetical protein
LQEDRIWKKVFVAYSRHCLHSSEETEENYGFIAVLEVYVGG